MLASHVVLIILVSFDNSQYPGSR